MSELQATRAHGASETAIFVVSYVDVLPPSMSDAAALLRQYREVSHMDAGQRRLEVLQQRGRPGHFAIVEQWQDQQAFEAHATAAHTRHVRERLRPLCASPYEERLHHGYALGATLTLSPTGATYVVTHADAVPPAKDDALALLQQLAEVSRTESGNVRFEVLQQSNRPNHLTVMEIWRDQEALDTHVMAAHTRHFREQFQPLSGSLYDERLYRALD